VIPKRFMEFIEEIVTSDEFEYGDGSPMTEDAKKALVEIQLLRAVADAARPICVFVCSKPSSIYWPDMRTLRNALAVLDEQAKGETNV